MAKKVIYGIGIVAISITILSYKSLENIAMRPSKRSMIMKEIGNKVLSEMGNPDCFLYSFGGGNQNNTPPPTCFFVCNRPFDINRDANYFINSYSKLILFLDQSSLKIPSREKYNRSNIEFTITWEDSSRYPDMSTYGTIQNWYDDTILLRKPEGGPGVKSRIIPYSTFKKLVKEKRFDEVLQYGTPL